MAAPMHRGMAREKVVTTSSVFVRAAADTRHSYSGKPRNSNLTKFLCHFPRVPAQSHATKRYLAVERPRVTRVERKEGNMGLYVHRNH